MNISNIVGALFPIFFVLALGYLAGKRHTFDADQAAGISKLALSFALPAALFVSMTGIPRDLLLGQGRLVLALILSHVGLFVIAWIALKQIASLHGAPAIIYSLMLATSATPVFGLAVLEPILGASSAGAVALVPWLSMSRFPLRSCCWKWMPQRETEPRALLLRHRTRSSPD